MSWNMVKLEDACTLITDGAHWSPEDIGAGYAMPSVKDMTDYGFDFTDCKKISEKDFKKLKSNNCCPINGDVLIAKDGSYLKHCFEFKGEENVAILSSIAIFRPDLSVVEGKFLEYLFRTPIIKSTARGYVSGVAVPRIVLKDFKTIELPIPPLNTQKRIADILSAYDDLIENNLKRIKLLEQAAQNIYKEWFVNMRFPGFEQTTINKETGLPDGWSISKYKNHFNVLTGKKDANHSNENGKYPFFTCGKEIIKSPDYSFDCEAILLAGNGDFNVKYYRGKFQAYQRTYVLSPHKSEELFLIYIHLDINLKHLTHGSKGSVIKYLTKGMVENVEFVLPDNSILNRFNNLCLNIFSKIENLKLQNQKLKQARDILLPRLMNQTIEV